MAFFWTSRRRCRCFQKLEVRTKTGSASCPVRPKPLDGAAVDGGKVGVVGLVARIGGLAKLLGGVGVKDANLESRVGEGALDRAVVASRPLDDDDQIFDSVPCSVRLAPAVSPP